MPESPKRQGNTQKMRRAAPVILLLLVQSCQNPFDFRRPIRLEVSEVAAPQSAPSQGNFTITLTVVTGGCKRFEGIRSDRTSRTLTLEARGTDAGPDAACPADIRFEPHPFLAKGPFTDPLTIIVEQPNSPPTTRIVRIE